MKRLERTLGLSSVVAISMGAMLGSGIFVLPGLAAGMTGPSVWLAYLVAALCVLPAALAKAEMATAMPTAGGTYVYLDRTFGPLVGTMAGIGLWLSLLLKSAFALVGFGAYLNAIHEFPLVATALVILVLIVVINLLGVAKVGKSLLLVVVLAVTGLGLLSLASAMHPGEVPVEAFFKHGGGGFLGTVAFVFVSYAGVTKVAAIAEEVKHPDRNLPLGILISLSAVTFLYAVVVLFLVHVIPTERLSTDLSPIYSLAREVFSPGVAIAFAVLGVLTMASMANAGLLASSRFPFAMSRERLLPPLMGWIDPRSRTPTVAIVATGVLMGAAIVFLDVAKMAKLASGFVILLFVAVEVAVIVLRESSVPWYRPSYRMPLYPALPAFGIVMGLVLLGMMGMTGVIAVVVAAVPGAIVYFSYGRLRARRAGVLSNMTARPDLVGRVVPPSRGDDGELTGHAAVTVAIFGWERSPETLVEVGAALADGRKLEVLHLTGVTEGTPVETVRSEEPAVRSLRRRVRAMAAERSLDIQFDAVMSRDLVETAADISQRLSCEWLVLASRSRQARHRFLFLNPLGWLTNHLDCNLAVYRDTGVRYIRKVLAYAEPGPDDVLVVSTADHLAAREGAEVTFVAFAPPGASKERMDNRRAYLEGLRALCTVPTHALVLPGPGPVRALAKATASYDLLVMAAAPPSGFFANLRGPAKDRLMERAHCSVLSLKAPSGRTHQEPFAVDLTSAPGAEEFDIRDHLERSRMAARLNLEDKDAVFTHAAQALARVGRGLEAGAIEAKLWSREREQHTFVGHGVALPHTTFSRVAREQVVVFTTRRPVNYGAGEGQAVDVIFSTLGPPSGRQVHLQIQASIAALILKTPLLTELRSATNADEMHTTMLRCVDLLDDQLVDEAVDSAAQ